MQTALDAAHAAAEGRPEDKPAEARFHAALLAAELLLLLEAEPEGETLRPAVVAVEDGRFALAFDRDERLAEFVGGPAPFAVLAGRDLAALLAGRGVGLGLNLGAPSATLLPPEAVDWLAERGRTAPEAAEARVAGVTSPGTAPEPLLAALGPKLAAMAGVVQAAHLVEARLSGGASGLLLVLAGVPEPMRPAVVAAVAEAALGEAALDVTFLEPGEAGYEAVLQRGLRLQLTQREARTPSAPGSDPGRPPRLR